MLTSRKAGLGIGIESGRSLGRELAFTHDITSDEAGESDCRTILFTAVSTPNYYDV
ncbi:hypothetical protein [Methylosinus sp. R-45379]|uniref:hypothetical protein n=1 Tax=Methylosinus sp. R-45379 TaxID=980563 RepID=UPI0012ED0A1E|nr:hypothetical protein [Methylosinus sp. R-45379]